MEYSDQLLEEIVSNFQFVGEVSHVKPIGNGHINSTYQVKTMTNEKQYLYSLQRINHSVFRDVEGLMSNIDHVTSFIKSKLHEQGKDAERGALKVVHTKDDKLFYQAEDGSYWRSYTYIDHVVALEQSDNAEDFYKTGLAFGEFQYMLQDFPAEQLVETIPDFHNTPVRLVRLMEAYKQNACSRAQRVKSEYEFVLQRADDCHLITDMVKRGEIPLRVTHNDTKINNILLDEETKDAVCIIDLDTVMPGVSVNDYGDAIRSGASTAAEDEKDVSKVHLDLDLFESFTKGFLKGCNGCLTKTEIFALPIGAKLMTLECGIRFLTDYLEGDVYFSTSYPEHNLDRAHTQFKLVEDMEDKWDQLNNIIKTIGGIQQ